VIAIDGKDATALPPAKRGLAMVFQSYALYPHMTVRKNISFPLKMAGMSEAEQAKVERAAKVLNLTAYLDRRPGQLSGGQRQRVAIGRAIVREPAAFLFDEPLSNLDAALRVGMRQEITELHQSLKTTMIYVTHDQVEAMTMADKIVVLNAGRIEQVGSPLELYNARQPVCRGLHRQPEDEPDRRGRGRQTRCRHHRRPARAYRHRRWARGRGPWGCPNIWARTPS
jgi:multiple sugar transport system ATP-binding protein